MFQWLFLKFIGAFIIVIGFGSFWRSSTFNQYIFFFVKTGLPVASDSGVSKMCYVSMILTQWRWVCKAWHPSLKHNTLLLLLVLLKLVFHSTFIVLRHHAHLHLWSISILRNNSLADMTFIIITRNEKITHFSLGRISDKLWFLM